MSSYQVAWGYHTLFTTDVTCQQSTHLGTLSCPTLRLACDPMLRLISTKLVLFPDFRVSNIRRYFYFILHYVKYWLIGKIFICFEFRIRLIHTITTTSDVFKAAIVTFARTVIAASTDTVAVVKVPTVAAVAHQAIYTDGTNAIAAHTVTPCEAVTANHYPNYSHHHRQN